MELALNYKILYYFFGVAELESKSSFQSQICLNLFGHWQLHKGSDDSAL